NDCEGSPRLMVCVDEERLAVVNDPTYRARPSDRPRHREASEAQSRSLPKAMGAEEGQQIEGLAVRSALVRKHRRAPNPIAHRRCDVAQIILHRPPRAAIYGRVSTTNHGQDVGLQTRESRQIAD